MIITGMTLAHLVGFVLGAFALYARAYTDLTPEDTATLERLGWHWSKQADSWGVFV